MQCLCLCVISGVVVSGSSSRVLPHLPSKPLCCRTNKLCSGSHFALSTHLRGTLVMPYVPASWSLLLDGGLGYLKTFHLSDEKSPMTWTTENLHTSATTQQIIKKTWKRQWFSCQCIMSKGAKPRNMYITIRVKKKNTLIRNNMVMLFTP